MSISVASANVLNRLRAGAARGALDIVLAHEPDIVGLQEWTVVRRRLLPRDHYGWVAPRRGECPIGYRRDRFQLVSSRWVPLSPLTRTDHGAGYGAGYWRFEPGRSATLTRLLDRASAAPISVINFHFVPGVQARGSLREDRPRQVQRHLRETNRLHELVGEELDRGQTVYAMGDSNLHGFAIPGLISAWTGRDDWPGTFGRRHIDDVFAQRAPSGVVLLETPSDHKALIATYEPDP